MYENALLLAILIVMILLFAPTRESYDPWAAPVLLFYPGTDYRGNPVPLIRGQKIRLGYRDSNGRYHGIWNSLHVTRKNMARLTISTHNRRCFSFKTHDNIADLYKLLASETKSIAAGDDVFLQYDSGA